MQIFMQIFYADFFQKFFLKVLSEFVQSFLSCFSRFCAFIYLQMNPELNLEFINGLIYIYIKTYIMFSLVNTDINQH